MLIVDVALGLLAGVLAGFLGVGGGFVIVPYLLWHIPDATLAQAMSNGLLAILPMCAASAWSHWRINRHHEDFASVLETLRMNTVIGGALGALAIAYAPDRLAAGVFAGLVGLAAYLSLTGKGASLASRMVPIKRRWLSRVPSGFLIGAGGGVIGAGGAFLSVPYLHVIQRLAMPLAVAGSGVTTLFVVAGAASAALTKNWLQGVHYETLLIAALAVCGIVGALLGARLTALAPAALLKKLFAVYMALLSVRMLYRALA
jgi:uncharacterized protein